MSQQLWEGQALLELEPPCGRFLPTLCWGGEWLVTRAESLGALKLAAIVRRHASSQRGRAGLVAPALGCLFDSQVARTLCPCAIGLQR
jgi:hypothetical protein